MMITLLLVYFIPFTICLLFAKLEKNPNLDKNHLVKCAMYPIVNIITAITVVYEILKNLVK